VIDFDVVSDAAAAAAGKRSRTAAPSPTVQLVRPSVRHTELARQSVSSETFINSSLTV